MQLLLVTFLCKKEKASPFSLLIISSAFYFRKKVLSPLTARTSSVCSLIKILNIYTCVLESLLCFGIWKSRNTLLCFFFRSRVWRPHRRVAVLPCPAHCWNSPLVSRFFSFFYLVFFYKLNIWEDMKFVVMGL